MYLRSARPWCLQLGVSLLLFGACSSSELGTGGESCQSGQRRCLSTESGAIFQTCGNLGTFEAAAACSGNQACDEALGCIACTPGKNVCNDRSTEVHACNPDGTIGALVQACGAGQVCQNAGCVGSGSGPVCGTYQALCNGTCTPTSNDPNNCGDCGIKCTGTMACSGGKCSSSCLPGLSICNNSCVDLKSDNRYCGSCSKSCPSGQGCVDGLCKPAATLGPAPASCEKGGPPINVIFPTAGKTLCAGALAQTTFTWALCSCADVKISQVFSTDGFDSTQGPYTPGGLGGGVGMNGQLRSSQVTTVGGTLWSSAATGISASSMLTVGQEIHSGGPVNVRQCTVGSDAFINGNATGNTLAIAKTLYQSPGATNSGVTYQSLVNTTAVAVPAPCACAPSDIIPVAGIVAARQNNNDNAAIGLDAALFSGGNPPQRLDLPCGNYYLNSLNTGAATTIVAHGRTALYIGGDIIASTPLSLTLDPGAELDIFVAGTIKSSSSFNIGSPNYPALSRTYVGSSAQLTFSSSASIGGNFYDGGALVKWSAPAEVYGSVFAGDFDSSSSVKIHYDRQVVKAGAACPGSPGGGGGGASCGSCKDCGNNACVGGQCSATCTNSSQCCAPLVCDNGKCALVIG